MRQIVFLVLIGALFASTAPLVLGGEDLPDLRTYDIQRIIGKTFKGKFTNDGPEDFYEDFAYDWYVDGDRIAALSGTYTATVYVSTAHSVTTDLSDWVGSGWHDIGFAVNYGAGRWAEVEFSDNYWEESFYFVT